MNRSQNSAKANPFTEEELELAQLFKAYALEWTPLPGQYVLDQEHVLPHESPFQPHVFFILDLDHFVRYTGSVERFREAFCWLPTWEQARQILRELGVSDAELCSILSDSQAFSRGEERLQLYRMIEDAMTGGLSV